MGIIQKQAIKGTFYSYLGVLVGFVTAGLLFPLILTTNEIGLVNLLVSFSVLFAQFASLGFTNVINRLFPYFRDERKGHNGFLSVSILLSLGGFVLSLILFEALKPMLIRNNIEDSTLFVDYINYILPLIFFTLFFNLLDNYNKAIYDAVLGTFLKEFLQRVFILISLGLYFFNLVGIHRFIQLYIISVSSPTVVLLIILFLRGEVKLIAPSKMLFSKEMIKEMVSLSLYGIIAGFSTLAILHIDRILVNKFLGLSATGIYATNFFFATLVIIPSRALLKISVTVIADSWKNNDLANIFLIYKKSVINQGIISMLILIGLWINIHNIYRILPEEYASGKWVILFVAIANMLTMSTGVSASIIATSVHYRVLTYFIIVFFILIIALNYLLIPILGISGAGLTFLVATLIYNLMRYVFVYRKFGMNPYNSKYALLVLISVITAIISGLVPEFKSLIADIFVRSALAIAIFVPAVYFGNISEDVKSIIDTVIGYAGRFKK